MKQSRRTSDRRGARRLCATLQSDWLAKFSAFDAAAAIDAERIGADIVDTFFEHEAAEHGGLDGVIAYELDGIALAGSVYIDAMTTEDILGPDHDPTIVLPLAEEPELILLDARWRARTAPFSSVQDFRSS